MEVGRAVTCLSVLFSAPYLLSLVQVLKLRGDRMTLFSSLHTPLGFAVRRMLKLTCMNALWRYRFYLSVLKFGL
jgi:hypothetical protein